MPLITTLIIAVLAAALIGIYGFIAYPNLAKAIFGEGKIYEQTYQFLLVTVIGGSIAWLFKEIDRLRGHRVILRDMHAELLQAYNRAKIVRRVLRAKLGSVITVDPDKKVAATDYEEQMEELSDSQLTFEVYAKRAKEPGLWFKDANALARSLEKIEKYLNEIVKEYEREYSKFIGDPPVRRLGELPMLMEFIGPYKQATEFQEKFKYPVREALHAIGKAMLR
jgi:hypothetical protein